MIFLKWSLSGEMNMEHAHYVMVQGKINHIGK